MQKWKGIGSYHDTRLINIVRENAVWQSYEALIKHVPIIKTLVAEGDTLALEALYVNVSGFLDSSRATH